MEGETCYLQQHDVVENQILTIFWIKKLLSNRCGECTVEVRVREASLDLLALNSAHGSLRHLCQLLSPTACLPPQSFLSQESSPTLDLGSFLPLKFYTLPSA